MKYPLLLFMLLGYPILNAQINVKNLGIRIDSELPDTLQSIFEDFLNNKVDKIAIASLKKRYNHQEYYHFLKQKKFFQSRKKWLKNNSHEETIIREGERYPFVHRDSIVFSYKYLGVDTEFIKSKVFLDSTETNIALEELFDGEKPELVDMCYIPRHAILFYDKNDKLTGITEICFECGKVKFGIVGVRLFSKYLPEIKQLFDKYAEEL